ncbi:Synaptojanin-2 [Cucumispora dikerogammari]|nr:Synaptojanin-2 [Cucumispora dikerogammari]
MNELTITRMNTIHSIYINSRVTHISPIFNDSFLYIIGLYHIEDTDVLLYVKEAQKIGSYNKTDIFKIITVNFYTFSEINLGILTDTCKFLCNSFFFYSTSKIDNQCFLWNEFPLQCLEKKYDITSSVCFLYCGYFGQERKEFITYDFEKRNELCNTVIETEGSNLFESDSSSIDLHMGDIQPNYTGLSLGLNNIGLASVVDNVSKSILIENKTNTAPIENVGEIDMCILSLISKERIGPRYLCRGIDDNSNVAMFVKTKYQLSQKLNDIYNSCIIKIYRGSIPLFWQQTEDLRKSLYFPIEPKSEKSLNCFQTHFKNLKRNSQIIVVINLLGKNKKDEKILSSNFTELLKISNILYDTFDLNKYQLSYDMLRIEFFKFLERIFAKIKLEFDNNNENFARLVMNRVVFRVNCLDCLDRTNVAQMMIIEFLLENYSNISNYNKNIDNKNIDNKYIDNKYIDNKKNGIDSEINMLFKKLWAENGNTLSIFYSNTNAHKNELSSKGARTIFGLIDDIMISASRVVYGNFSDKQKDVLIKSLLTKKQSTTEETFKGIKERIGLINCSIAEETDLDTKLTTVLNENTTKKLLEENSINFIIVSIQILKNYLYSKTIDINLENSSDFKLISKKIFKSNVILVLSHSRAVCDIINVEFNHSNTYDIFNIKYLLKLRFQLKLKDSLRAVNVYSILVTDLSVFQALKKRLDEKEINIINLTTSFSNQDVRNESIFLINEFLYSNVFEEKFDLIECLDGLQNNLTYFNKCLFRERMNVKGWDSSPHFLIMEIDL